jgi:DNA helicase MCM8
MQNVNLEPAILSRFDLIFVLLDRPNNSFDRVLSSHVIRGSTGEKIHSANESFDSLSGYLLCKLKKGKALDTEFVQRYIAFARSNINPRLSIEASDRIKEAYLRLRKKSCEELNSFPVIARSIESLIRLSEARAKASLSPIVTLQHAEEVIELYQHCLTTFNAGNTFQKGKRVPKAANKRKFILALDSQFAGKSEFTKQELATVAQQCQIENFEEFLHLLNINGFLLKNSSGNWKRL